MILLPAIDLYEGKAVRLFKGDYNQMTVYNENPLSQAKEFEKCGAEFLHMVDLEGAKTGDTPNLETIKEICENTNLFVELGGGIRSMEVAERYLSIGVDRVILGTAAVTDEGFLLSAAEKFGEKLAVGVDIKDGYVSIKGWTENSQYTLHDFCEKLQNIGIKTVICTDISKDGAMKGANLELYKELSQKYSKLSLHLSGNILGSSLDSEECVNDALLAVWNNIPPENPENLKTYFLKIVRNLSIKKYHSNKALKRNSCYDIALDELENILASDNQPDSEYSLKELAHAINTFLGTLTKD